MLGLGLNFLAHHDTEYGHLPLARRRSDRRPGAGSDKPAATRGRDRADVDLALDPPRRRAILALAWAVPAAALCAAAIPLDGALARSAFVRGLISRCRFVAVPADDVERLALWCREHTPRVGAVHRAARPQDVPPLVAAKPGVQPRREPLPRRRAWPTGSLAFRTTSDFHGDAEEFVQRYLADRHGFEARYEQLERRRAGRPRRAPGCDLRRRRQPRRSTRAGGRCRAESPLELSTSKDATRSIG